MHRVILTIACALSLAAGRASAQPAAAPTAVMATVSRMTDAVNRGDMPTAFAAFTASPTIVEDLPPYRWQGPGTPQAWIAGMGANAEAHGITAINMRLAPATRIDVTDDRAYVIVPGLLSFKLTDGHSEHANGFLTVLLQRTGGDWKIDTLIWSGPRTKR